MGGRWALYCGSISMRTRGLPLSNAQMTPLGRNFSTSFTNIETKPKMALVGRPSGVVIVGGMAWKARCMSELPSTTAMVRRASGLAALGVASSVMSSATCGSFCVPSVMG